MQHEQPGTAIRSLFPYLLTEKETRR